MPISSRAEAADDGQADLTEIAHQRSDLTLFDRATGPIVSVQLVTLLEPANPEGSLDTHHIRRQRTSYVTSIAFMSSSLLMGDREVGQEAAYIMFPTADSHGRWEAGEPAVVADRLRRHVEQLAARIGERNLGRPGTLEAAADYVEAQWRTNGYEVRRQVYEVRGVASANLEATLPGDARAQEILVIGAHYDTVPGSPGANDNASGVAALLEIARALRTLRPNLTLRFVAFVNEEPPFFMTHRQGSSVYAREARARGDDIRLMVALETIGYYSDAPGSQRYPPIFGLFYPNRADFIGLVSDFRSRRRTRRLARAFREASDFPLQQVATFRFIPGVAWSDHLSFWSEGYRAVMVTDTAYYRYAYYHGAEDTPDKLTYVPFAQVTTGLAHAFSALAMNGVDG